MNLVLLLPEDFEEEGRAVLRGRRREHIARVHRAAEGDTLTVGIAGGKAGRATIETLTPDAVTLRVVLDREPPPPLGVVLVLALPRPKVLNRAVAAAASMGIKRLFLINAWRVEKSYWSSPRLSKANLREQSIAGLEQARDTILPQIEARRFFRRFVEDELPAIAEGTLRLVAHPGVEEECPRAVVEPVTLVVGPEGGFIAEEIASLEKAGFRAVTTGPRILRVETAVTALLARLTPEL